MDGLPVTVTAKTYGVLDKKAQKYLTMAIAIIEVAPLTPNALDAFADMADQLKATCQARGSTRS